MPRPSAAMAVTLCLVTAPGSTAAGAPRTVPLREILGLTGPALAARLLPAEEAARVTEGRLFGGMVPGLRFAILWERASVIGPTICGRRGYSGAVRTPPGETGRAPDEDDAVATFADLSSFEAVATTWPEPATPERCAPATAYVSSPAGRRHLTIAALNKLTAAMEAARRRGKLGFEITCEEKASRCSNPRAALAQLPLEAIRAVKIDAGDQLARVLTEGGPFGFVVPGPANYVPQATIEIGMSKRDFRSWHVTLVEADGKVVKVVMKHLDIIYH
jgi:hypothetical protein